MPCIYLVTGPQAAGKTTVARLLAKRFARGVHLMPSVAAGAERAAGRGESRYTHWTVEQLHRLFSEETPHVGLWLDTSDQTPEQTVEAILSGS